MPTNQIPEQGMMCVLDFRLAHVGHDLPTHRTKVPYTAFGSAGKSAFDYVTRRFNLSSARLNKPHGLDLR